MSPGMMGGWGVRGLGLTASQEAQVNKLSDELLKKNWELLGKMQDEGARLRDLYASDTIGARLRQPTSDWASSVKAASRSRRFVLVM